MTNKEAIETIKIAMAEVEWNYPMDYTVAFEMAIDAIEKQMPNKPAFSHNLSDTISVFHCECGNTIKVSHDAGIMNNNNAPNYCSKCGCRLDWEEEDV